LSTTAIRKAVLARDEALSRTRAITRRIGVAAVAGSLVLAAGFAHLIPTHLPRPSPGQGNGQGSGGSGNGGLQGPGSGPGQGSGSSSQTTSGGS
jgi:hypothetical protein